MAESFIVRPLDRKEAIRLCASHPHAPSLPNSSKYYMRLDINGKFSGFCSWGYGAFPKNTPRALFNGHQGVKDYLELCRFFVLNDKVPKNTASKFLTTTHRILKKHAPQIKWLYTCAAGFQGLIGTIYKASGYDYIGKKKIVPMIMIPGIGLVHCLSLMHRYHYGAPNPKFWQQIFPGCKSWNGYNFKYIYWLCDDKEKKNLLSHAAFKIEPYPSEKDLEIWTIDQYGKKEIITIEEAKKIPVIKLKSKRVGSKDNVASGFQSEEGGATPTPTLQNQTLQEDKSSIISK